MKMRRLKTICLILMMSISFECLAITIKLSSFDSYEKDNDYLLDATFALELSEEVLKALKHGIPLQINTDVEVRMIRDWYPDKTIQSINYIYQLTHQPLTEDYLTVNLKTGLRAYYDSLSAALMNIGQFSNIKLVSKKNLSTKNQFKGRIRMYLDLDSLPAPMRPQVYFSDSWDIDSDWHEWLIKE